MDVICLKWGDKFNHEHVNRLYRMVCKNLDDDFNFICYTENSNNINSNIIIRPLPDYDLENWWWKLTLFEHTTKNITLFLDLDVVIQNNITHLKKFYNEFRITLIKAWWKPKLINAKENINSHFDMDYNSSVMLWNGDMTDIWNKFYENPEYYMMKYKGIDSYLYFHHFKKLNYFPKKVVYSRLYGYNEKNYWDTKKYDEPPNGLYYKPNFKICIFNGWERRRYEGKGLKNGKYLLDDEGYDGFEAYWN